jgi:xanthine phosphoribosyltransferase
VDTCVKEFRQNKWISFPWDIEYQFSTAIKDRPQMELRFTPPQAA